MIRALDVGTTFGMSVGNIFLENNTQVLDCPRNLKQTEDLVNWADIVLFGGGEDINPSVYGAKNIASYVHSHFPSQRDLFEIEVWKMCQRTKTPVLGICRGAQLVCALSGGILVQNIHGKHGFERGKVGHIIHTDDGRTIDMTTAHHQMMFPFGTEHQLVAWTKAHPETLYHIDVPFGKYDVQTLLKQEPEVVFFPKTNALGVQGHPEFLRSPHHEAPKYTRELVNRFFNLNV